MFSLSAKLQSTTISPKLFAILLFLPTISSKATFETTDCDEVEGTPDECGPFWTVSNVLTWLGMISFCCACCACCKYLNDLPDEEEDKRREEKLKELRELDNKPDPRMMNPNAIQMQQMPGIPYQPQLQQQGNYGQQQYQHQPVNVGQQQGIIDFRQQPNNTNLPQQTNGNNFAAPDYTHNPMSVGGSGVDQAYPGLTFASPPQYD